MGWLDRLRGALRPWDGTAGRPPSGNGASSFHLAWELGSVRAPIVAAEVTLEVLEPPVVPDLHFWALQVSFTDADGRRGGGAHLGLQWYRPHPGSTAVNWGGYRHGGGELDGTASALPSATGNPNTRDYPWRAGVAYRLAVTAAGPDLWQGSVTDTEAGVTTVVRALHAPGDRLDGLMVWSEVFADCDAPGSAVRWRDPVAVTADGTRHRAPAVRVNYQALADGGCATTDSSVDDRGVVQRTGTTRHTAQGATLTLPAPTGPDPQA